MRLYLLMILCLILVTPCPAAELTASEAAQISQAQQAINDQQAASTIEPLLQLINTHPDLPQAHRLLGHAYALTGQSELARKHLILAITHGQMTADTLARLYQLDHAKELHLANLGQLLLLISLEPDNAQYPMLLAQTYESLSNPQTAQTIYQTQLHKQPGNPQLLLKLGNLAIKAGDYNHAIIYLQTAQYLGQTPHTIKQTISWLYEQIHQPAQALYWHIQAWPRLEEAPAQQRLERARLHWQVGDQAAANQIAQQLIELNELADQALMFIARMAIQSDQPQTARTCFEKLADMDKAPTNITAYLGSIAFNDGDYAKAAYYLSMTDKLEPLSRDQLLSLIISYLHTNDRSQTRMAIQSYIVRFELDDQVSKCIKQWSKMNNASQTAPSAISSQPNA